MPRYSCACHKCNIAVRLAITKDKYLPLAIRILSNYSAIQKATLDRVKLSIKCRARLRIQNKTRWLSEYLLLESHYKGYIKNIFPEDFPCPVKFEALEIWLQVLYPAFKFNLTLQRTTSTIADVLPLLQLMFTKWSRMELTPKYDTLRQNLIKSFEHKFKHELSSPVYHVATLFNVSKHHIWINRNDCSEIKLRALENINNVALEILKIKSIPKSVSNESNGSSGVDSMVNYNEDDDYPSSNTGNLN